MADNLINVEVAYAKPTQQALLKVELPAESTAEQAILASGILQLFPEIDLGSQKIGIFSQVCPLQQSLDKSDRIEIYRPLQQDPMTARRNRLPK